MSDKTELNSYLRITGVDCDPALVTKLLGIAPTRTWKRGQSSEQLPGLKLKDSGWELAAPVNTNLEASIQSLLDSVDSLNQKLSKLPADWTPSINCSLYLTGHGGPDLSLSHKLVTRLHELRTGIDIDVYCI